MSKCAQYDRSVKSLIEIVIHVLLKYLNFLYAYAFIYSVTRNANVN